jgi:hypothetical protein
MILGVVFLLAGMIYLIIQGGGGGEGNFIFGSIADFFAASSSNSVLSAGETVYSIGNWGKFLWFIPGIIVLVFPFYLGKQNPVLAKFSAIAGSIWVFALHLKILGYDVMINNAGYPTIWVAACVTLAAFILPIWHFYKQKNRSIIWMILLMFYISFVLLNIDYNWYYSWRLLYIIFFTWIILYVCFKTDKLVPFYLHSFISILILVLFLFHRLEFMTSSDQVWIYVSIATLYYLTIFISGLKVILRERKARYELTAIFLILVNTLFYWGSVLFALQNSGFGNLKGVFTLLLAIVNGIFLYFLPKLRSDFSRNFHILLTLFLFSMSFSLWSHQNNAILFSALFSILLIYYSRFAKNRFALLISLVFLLITVVLFIYKWIVIYFPGYWEGAVPMPGTLFYDGFQSGLFTVLAIFFIHHELKSPDMPLPGRWFHLRIFRRYLKIFFITALYVSGFWCWNFIFSILFPVIESRMPIWFFYTLLFLVILLPTLAKQKSSLLNSSRWLAFFLLPVYPSLVNPAISSIMLTGLNNNAMYRSLFLSHYLFLPVIIALVIYLYSHFMRRPKRKRTIIHLVQALVLGYGLWLFMIEYDQFTVFFWYTGKVSTSEMISQNHHLPYSIILLVASLLLTIYSVIRNHRFTLQLTFLIFLAALVKIFIFDFTFLGVSEKIVTLFVLGGLLIVFSFLFQRFRKAARKVEEIGARGTRSQGHRVIRSQDDSVTE